MTSTNLLYIYVIIINEMCIRDRGYAEADPTADVEGYDACRKIAILSSLAYERYFDFEDIYTEGCLPLGDLPPLNTIPTVIAFSISIVSFFRR